MRPTLGECSNFRKRQHYYRYYKLNVKLLCHHILYIPTLSMSHSVFGQMWTHGTHICHNQLQPVSAGNPKCALRLTLYVIVSEMLENCWRLVTEYIKLI